MSRGRVLIVDDSEMALASARLALEEAGLEVETLASPLSLPLAVHRVDPDVVLLDVSMPSLRGDVALKLTRDRQSVRDVVVLLHSAREAGELAGLVERSGADGYIVKSHDVEAFAREVIAWVGRARKRRHTAVS